MVDVYADFNGDLVIAQDGDIQRAVGWDQVRQRIIRRMITNPQQTLPSGVSTPADYIFHPDYGFGLGTMVDGDYTQDFLDNLKRRISQAVFEDADVDTSIPPSIKFQQPQNDQLWIIIGVTLKTGYPGQISIKVT